MKKLPGLVIVVDPGQEHIAVAEANKLGIPVMALVDTNCDPDPIDYVIACNDDALKSIRIILETLAHAIIEKKNELKAHATKEGRGESEGRMSEEFLKEGEKESALYQENDAKQ
jgi:small subunit ribosomal protein S2